VTDDDDVPDVETFEDKYAARAMAFENICRAVDAVKSKDAKALLIEGAQALLGRIRVGKSGNVAPLPKKPDPKPL
jgi:hypothetical protein